MRYHRGRRLFSNTFLTAALAVVLAPMLFVAIASLDYDPGGTITFPPRHLTLAAYAHIPVRYWRALLVTVEVATAATIGACAIGIPAAFGLVRSRIVAKWAVAAVFRAPLQIPAVVSGLAFLQLYYALQAATGWLAAGTLTGLAIAHTFAATPYVVGTMVGVLQRFDGGVEEAARILGATKLGVLRQVTLPMLRPGLFAGALYAFMTSFGEVPMSVFLTGSHRVTFPVEVFNSLQFDFEPAILAVSTVVTFLSFLLVWSVQRLIGLDVFVQTGAVE